MQSFSLSPQLCYIAAICGAFITALSQILLKTQANTTGGKGFFSKFLNVRVIVSYGLLFLTLAINQVALRYVPLSVMPCITSTSFVWVFVLGALILKEKISARKILGVAVIIAGVLISRLSIRSPVPGSFLIKICLLSGIYPQELSPEMYPL